MVRAVRFVVGCVSQLYQGDLDLGRRVAERLEDADLGEQVTVEDMHYGAVAVAQRLEELIPEALVLVGAEERGRQAGTVTRRRIEDLTLDPADVQVAVGDAGTGYVGMDLVVEVAGGLGALPDRTVVIEVEPARTQPDEELSGAATAALEEAVDAVRREVRRLPVLTVSDEIRRELARGHLDESAALEALRGLLDELEVLDREGRWGRTFAERDRLRLRISMAETSENMSHVDWGLWWALIEELDRLERTEALADLERQPPPGGERGIANHT